MQNRVAQGGIEIIEAKISHLAYAQEIAPSMLRKQQAQAVIAARKEIVRGAVSMVEMAVNEVESNNIAELDEKRKEQLVSNLLIVLCGEEKG